MFYDNGGNAVALLSSSGESPVGYATSVRC